jgi:WD40 associated region in TFIID subunit, NTD2 domain
MLAWDKVRHRHKDPDWLDSTTMASQENHAHPQPNGLQPPQSAVDEVFLNGQQPVRDVPRQVLDVVTGQIIAARGHTQLGENIQARAQGLGTSVVARQPYEKSQYVGDHIPYHRGSDGKNIFDNASLMQEKLQAGLQHIAPLSLTSILATENLKASAQLMEDPIPRQIAFRDLQVWVEGSLDMYKVHVSLSSLFNVKLTWSHLQPEFRPLLFPVFVHFYLDFVAQGFKEAGKFF